MFGMGLGRIGRMGGIGGAGGSGSLPIASIGSRITFWGDGVNAEGSAPGIRCWPAWALASFNGRLMPSAAWMQCKSGSTLDTVYDRRTHAVKQAPDIFVYASDGHNDGIYSSGYSTHLTKWIRNGQYAIDNLPSTTRIVFTVPLTSAVAAETTGGTWATTVGDLIRAQVATWQATYGSRIILFDTLDAAIGGYGPWDHTTMSNDADKTHPNSLGGFTLGKMFFALMDSYVESATMEAILADTTAKTWRGANIHPDYALSGTSGTKSGTVTPTGNYATGQRITNNLLNGTSVAVAVSKVAQTGYDQQLANISGTPAATQTVKMDDTANITLTGGSPGTYWVFQQRVTIDDGAGAAPVGLNTFEVVLGSIGSLFGVSDLSTAGYNSAIGVIDQVFVAAPKATFASDTAVANPEIETRFTASALDARITIERPQLFQVEKVAYAVPYYIGDDTILGTNFQVRATGTGVTGNGYPTAGSITAASVGTIRVETGTWSGGNLTFSRVMRKNGGVVSGAFSSAWTYNAAGTLIAGDTVEIDVTATNSSGTDTKTLTFNVV